jgi:hypothetical protein
MEQKSYTLWDVVDGVCAIHGDYAHAMYVLDGNGERVTTFDGDTRVPEETGRVVLECVYCQFPPKK